jgi:hypothetical protein
MHKRGALNVKEYVTAGIPLPAPRSHPLRLRHMIPADDVTLSQPEEKPMNSELVSACNNFMNGRFNPLEHMDLASCHYPMQALAWMWSMSFSVLILSMYLFGYIWLSQMLLIAGVFTTLTIFKTSETRRTKPSPALYLSSASKCVWKMDSEA